MEVVLSQFTKSLTRSGLMTADEVEAFIESLPPDKKPTDGRTLAQELVRHKKLTKFQAQAVYQGKTKGLTLGDYVVLERIGQGGMGQVFKAKHKVMDRVVALKTLPAAATNSKLAVQRFHREVKVAARLSHPNIVTAHDAGESHGLHYLVMECVEGDDLGAAVKQRGRLPASKGIDYIIQAAKGLEYAHSEKVIHRDIKPSNLLLDKKGTVKVLDMGLARLNEAIGPLDQTEQETLTGTGQVMGTIDFMPPEQAENTKKADERSDIYSLGCTLYYILTGQAIYSGDTVVMKILAHRETAIPSLRAELPGVSEQLDAVYQKMVAKKPADRYGSMTEVIAELEKCASPPEDIPETATFEGFSLKGTAASDQTLNLEMPVISPVDEFRRGRPKKVTKVKLEKNHIIYGSVALGVVFVLILLGVVFSMRTPEGTLVIEVNQPDAEISVDDGKVTLKSPSDKEPVQVEVEEGKHTLSITKGGFRTFAREFEITSGGEEVVRVRLVPLEKKVAARPKPVVQSTGGAWALEFGPTKDYVETLVTYDGTHPITLEAYVTVGDNAKQKTYGHVLTNYGEAGGICLQANDTGNRHAWAFAVQRGPHPYYSQGRSRTERPMGKQHVAMVYASAMPTLFVNGQLQETEVDSAYTADGKYGYTGSDSGFCIGGHRIRTSFFNGIIDEVRISNIARYTEDFTPEHRFEPDEHTMALYHFDEGSGDVLHDSSGNGHDGKIVGAKWVKVDEGEGVVADDPNRRVAEWVLGIGGKVKLSVGKEQRQEVERVADLPEGVLSGMGMNILLGNNARIKDSDLANLLATANIHTINLNGSSVSDDGLVYLANLTECVTLTLYRARVTGEGLKNVAKMSKLQHLSLNETRIQDADLTQLAGVITLATLELSGTQITDAGLQHLKMLTNLTELNLTDTKVTAKGVADLQAALPNCTIILDSEGTPDDASMTPSPQPPFAIAPFTPEQAKQHQQAWADYLGLPVELENSIGMKMVLIPPGEYSKGTTQDQVALLVARAETLAMPSWYMEQLATESPPERVALERAFYLSKHEVTVGQFKQFAEAERITTAAELEGGWVRSAATGSFERQPGTHWKAPGYRQSDENPVVFLTRDEGTKFCQWLSRKETRSYLLPTEDQWEYACRVGSEALYGFGDDRDGLSRYAWFASNAQGHPHPVGTKETNPWGLHDMHGNVHEWCREKYLRGGCWQNDADMLRSAYRNVTDGEKCTGLNGFRPVLLIDPNNPPKPTPKPPAESPKSEPTPEPKPTSEMQPEKDEADQTPKISRKLRHTLESHTGEALSAVFHPKGQMGV